MKDTFVVTFEQKNNMIYDTKTFFYDDVNVKAKPCNGGKGCNYIPVTERCVKGGITGESDLVVDLLLENSL